MSKPDYDTTLARIAGNVAAGLIGTPHYVNGYTVGNLAIEAVDIAQAIVERCKSTKSTLSADWPHGLALLRDEVLKQVQGLEADCRCGNLSIHEVNDVIKKAMQ
jgi:hypothetical protein